MVGRVNDGCKERKAECDGNVIHDMGHMTNHEHDLL